MRPVNTFNKRSGSRASAMIIHIALAFLLFSNFRVFSQDEKEKWGEGEIQKVEIAITKDRQITVPQASRNFEKVPPRPAEPIKPEITYQFRNLSFNISDYNPAIRPLKLKTETISKIYGNYVSLGFGNYSSPYAEAYLTNKRNKNKYYGAKFYHRSFMTGPVDSDNSASGNTEIRLFGKTMNDKVALGGFIDYENTTAHFYGYRPGENVSASSIRQSYSIFSLGGDIENSKSTDFKYNLKAGYSYLSDHYSASESELNLNWLSEYKISKEKKFILNADYFLISRKDAAVSLNSRHLFKAKPAYQFTPSSELTLTAGANVIYENDTINKQNGLHVYPNLTANYALSPSVDVYGALLGDVDKVSIHSLSRENVWINSNIGVFNTNRALEFCAGLRGRVSGKILAGAGASFATLKNLYYYQSDVGPTQQAKFNVFYDEGSTQRTNFFGELAYSGSTFKLNARTDYWIYSTSVANQIAKAYAITGKSFENSALQRPQYRLNVNASYNIYDKLLLEADFIGQGGMKALDIASKNLVTLNAAVDLNARANYFVSKQFSVFLAFNNMLASNYQLYLNYPVRGFQVLGGASWSF
ncbi:hypothetical protein WSM22_28200 [Cytophagales bacterium WSM2-2]|nr:hypothetical protein WSM22_28200 [Cytophagales bacterium WSM2-2]